MATRICGTTLRECISSHFHYCLLKTHIMNTYSGYNAIEALHGNPDLWNHTSRVH